MKSFNKEYQNLCLLQILIDGYKRDYLGFEVDVSINGNWVCSFLERIGWLKGLPEMVTMDHEHRVYLQGAEFLGASSRGETGVQSGGQTL
jgi:hypothetical protein